jgi:response regulator RpfG family c-di-GMP phosphodiesterase
MNTESEHAQKVALVVDDEQVICNMMVRVLSRYFDEVLAARTPIDAERLLTENQITHMVCDCNLGKGLPLAIEFIPKWRSLASSMERVVVFSGTDLSNTEVPPEVDAVVDKGMGVRQVLNALKVS